MKPWRGCLPLGPGPQFPICKREDCTGSVALSRGRFCSPKEYDAGSGDTFGGHAGEDATSSQWVEPSHVAQAPTMHRTGPYNKISTVRRLRDLPWWRLMAFADPVMGLDCPRLLTRVWLWLTQVIRRREVNHSVQGREGAVSNSGWEALQ